jgi:hypothetical protein
VRKAVTEPDEPAAPEPFPILSPGDPGYPEAIARAKEVFAGKRTGWRLADCELAEPS